MGPCSRASPPSSSSWRAGYRRTLRRQAVLAANRQGASPFAPAPAPAPTPAPPAAPAAAPATAGAPEAAEEAAPVAKKRRSLMGAVAAKQFSAVEEQGEDESLLDLKIAAEIEKFEQIRCKILNCQGAL